MLRRLFTLIVCLVAAVATASAQTPPDNEIWYTTTDGRPLFINSGYKYSVGLYMYSDTYNNPYFNLDNWVATVNVMHTKLRIKR